MAAPFHGTDPEGFYTHLFTENPFWSSSFPNRDEALRLAKILEYLSLITQWKVPSGGDRLRILDAGCGRGWLTQAVSIYGDSEGLDPVAAVINSARKTFPQRRFFADALGDFIKSPDFVPYDVVIASEVIEHVLDKQAFVGELGQAAARDGYVILTTPRGEEFKKWLRLGYEKQPIEEWISEREIRMLFAGHDFEVIEHGRVCLDLAPMSLLHLACASPRIRHFMERVRLDWVRAGLLYMAGFYQTWLFRKLGK